MTDAKFGLVTAEGMHDLFGTPKGSYDEKATAWSGLGLMSCMVCIYIYAGTHTHVANMSGVVGPHQNHTPLKPSWPRLCP